MQYVNDDMDDVFRKAAEGYPLDTSGADWNKVLAGLQDPINTPAKKRGHRRFLWLLMLLPLGLVCNYYYPVKNLSGLSKNDTDQVSNSQSNETVKDTRGFDNDVVINSRTEIPPVGSHDVAVAKDGTVSSQNGKKYFKPDTYGSEQVVNAKRKPGRQFNKGIQRNEPTGVNSTQAPEINANRNQDYTGFIDPTKISLPAVLIHPSAGVRGLEFNQSKKTGLERNPKRFYLGLMGGIDVTTIEFQKTTNTGFDYGVLAGYKIGRRWAVEAAAFIDKKYYYTEGKYFKYDGYLPPNTWITDVEGYCKMWDISLGGTYSLSQGNKSGWFAATGISSYIMKKENYDYTYYYAGSGISAIHSKSYSNQSTNLCSIINLSMGYTHRLGKITDLRVEPYMKIPVQGVGVGNLSLFSAGVHIGITGKLF